MGDEGDQNSFSRRELLNELSFLMMNSVLISQNAIKIMDKDNLRGGSFYRYA